jgi:hypothetical protein
MTNQLSLLTEPGRVYLCCGRPCAPLSETKPGVWPHAEDCPNPNVGVWVDRATGWMIRRLGCMSVNDPRPCPYGGAFPPRPGLADPYGGACCKTLRGEVAAGESAHA